MNEIQKRKLKRKYSKTTKTYRNLLVTAVSTMNMGFSVSLWNSETDIWGKLPFIIFSLAIIWYLNEEFKIYDETYKELENKSKRTGVLEKETYKETKDAREVTDVAKLTVADYIKSIILAYSFFILAIA